MFTDETNVVFITCGGLNDAKKALFNEKIYDMLGVINMSDMHNLDNIKVKSKWVNAAFNEDIKKSNHFAFGFTMDNIHDILSFSSSLLNNKANLITFLSTEEKSSYPEL